MNESTVKQDPFLIDPTGREHTLTNEDTTIGRAVGNDIIITSKRVSREHAHIRRDGWKAILEDSGSTNGTYLNEERLMTAAVLRDQDRIKIGDVVFQTLWECGEVICISLDQTRWRVLPVKVHVPCPSLAVSLGLPGELDGISHDRGPIHR